MVINLSNALILEPIACHVCFERYKGRIFPDIDNTFLEIVSAKILMPLTKQLLFRRGRPMPLGSMHGIFRRIFSKKQCSANPLRIKQKMKDFEKSRTSFIHDNLRGLL